MKKKIIYIIISFLVFCVPLKTLNADIRVTITIDCNQTNQKSICSSYVVGSGESPTLQGWAATFPYKRTYANQHVFCSEFYKPVPAEGGYCSADTTWDVNKPIAIAIGYILNTTQNPDYIAKEIIINGILGSYFHNGGYVYTYPGHSGFKYKIGNNLYANLRCDYTSSDLCYEVQTSSTSSGSNSTYMYISDKDRNIKNQVVAAYSVARQYYLATQSTASIGTISSSDDSNEYIVNLNNSPSADYDASITGNGLSCTISNKTQYSFKATCDSENSGTIAATISVTYKNSYHTAQRYYCGEGYQKVFISEPLDQKATSSKTININTRTCDGDAKKYKGIENLKNRIAAYKYWTSKGKDARGLLNVDSETCNYSPVEPELSCLSGDYNNPETNLTEFTGSDDKKYYCFTKLNLSNIIDEFNSIKKIKTGQGIKFPSIILEVNLSQTCYDENGNQTTTNFLDLNNYSKYLGEVNLKNNDNEYVLEIDPETLTLDRGVIKVQYKFPIKYINFINGRISNDSTRGRVYKGILSKLTNDDGKIDFSIKFSPSGSVLSYYHSSDSDNYCRYNVENEIIDIRDGEQKLNLEFEIINTRKGILDKNGNPRTVGKNWCTELGDCSGDNQTIKTYIINSNDSYNKTGAGPKYIINLDSKKIDSIRDYNKQFPYDDFILECPDDNKCYSGFLTSYITIPSQFNSYRIERENALR